MNRRLWRDGPLDAARKAALAAMVACALAAPGPAAADDNIFLAGHGRHLVSDPRTGLALFGYDAVAYHVEHKARPGSPSHELMLDGKIWRFATAANRAAFEQTPAAYLPLFGGHDAAAVAAGLMVKGDPVHFALVGGRLALFRDAEARDRFAAEPELRTQALRAWPEVVRLQAGH